MEGHYQRGKHSIGMYLQQTAIANPHLTLHYVDPGGERFDYERSTKVLPPEAVEIKPHPHGVELGLVSPSPARNRSCQRPTPVIVRKLRQRTGAFRPACRTVARTAGMRKRVNSVETRSPPTTTLPRPR